MYGRMMKQKQRWKSEDVDFKAYALRKKTKDDLRQLKFNTTKE